jgi:hypothetical protein
MSDISLITNEGAIDLSRPTQADLSALQYHNVKHSTAELVVACGLNEAPLGILQNAPTGSATAEATAVVRIQGVSKLKIAEAVAFGDRLTSTAASKGEVVDAADEEICARTLTSGDTDDLVAVQLMFGKSHSSDA